MPTFGIDIIETLQMRVEVKADSLEDAIEQVRDDYYDEVHVLDADNSNVSVDFEEVE